MSDHKLCYNKGCSKQFDPAKNHSGACVYHPGDPYFHDAYKEWTCCKKRSVDFTEFLNFRGCQTSFHNAEKPPEKPKPVEAVVEEQFPLKPREAMPRPDINTTMTILVPEVAESLKKALTEQIGKIHQKSKEISDSDKTAKVGDACQNRGCTKTYTGKHDDDEICIYHPGFPVFHEGMKYWSCCQRKTSEFDAFMKQEGCERGNHNWTRVQKVATCRTDWHQTATHVYATFYAKSCIPEKSSIELNPVKLRVKLAFDAGQSMFEKQLVLGGIVDVENSQVTMVAPKVEVRMKKAEPVTWKDLTE